MSAGAWAGVFLAAFVLYAATASRGIQWQDSGAHILRIVEGELISPRGLALSHPLHYWLGRAAVRVAGLEPALAVTLVSSLAAAAAVANVYGCVVLLTGWRPAGLFAAASLGLAHTVWQLATLTETYTLTAALLAGECWCLVGLVRRRRAGWLYGMALLNGLGVANHLLAGLTTPVLVVVAAYAARKQWVPWRHVAAAAGLWLVGSLPYTGLVAAEMVRSGEVAGTIASALVGREYGDEVLNLSPSPRTLLISAAFPLYNFPNLLLPAAVYGIARARRTRVPAAARRALLAGLIIHALFVVRYSIVDQQTFFLPTYVLLAIFGGIGAAAVRTWSPKAQVNAWALAVVLLMLTPVVYAVTPAVARRAGVLERLVGPRKKPYRDEYVYFFSPWSVVERSASRLGREAITLAGPDGLLLCEDPMAMFALKYERRRHNADDVDIRAVPVPEYAEQRERLLDAVRRAAEAGRPVVLVPLDANKPQLAPPRGRWERHEDLYVLETTGRR